MEWLTNLSTALASPIGAFLLMVLIGYTGWRGYWVWKREIDRERAENVFLRGLVNQLAGVQEKQVLTTDRAISVAAIRAEILNRSPE